MPSECYIGHVLNTITSKFRDAAGFRVMRNIIPNTSSDLEQSETPRTVFVFESRVVIFTSGRSGLFIAKLRDDAR